MKPVVRLPRTLRAASLPFLKAAALLLLMIPEAFAQSETLVLTWSAPHGCPSESEVTSAVLRNATLKNAGNRSSEAPTVLVARAQVSERAGGGAQLPWYVRLYTQRGDARGQREIEAESCAALAQATAVVLSLALLDLKEEAPDESDAQTPPIAGLENENTRKTSGAAQDSVQSSKTEPIPELKSDRRRTKARRPAENASRNTLSKQKGATPRPASASASAGTPWLARFSAGARGGFTFGTLPRPAPGGALSVAWLPGAFRLEVDAKMWGEQSQSIEDTPSGADLLLRSLGVRACLRARSSPRLELSPCVGSELHLLRARGFGSDANYDTNANWPALTGGLLGLVKLTSKVALRADIEGQIPLARPRFFVERIGTVHRIPPWAVAALFGAEVHFP